MKKLIAAVLCILCVSVLSGQETMKIICEGVSIEVPVKWQAEYSKSPSLFFLYSPLEQADTFQENCNLAIEHLPGTYTVAEYMEAALENIQIFYTDFEILDTQDDYCIFKGAVGNTQVQQMQYYFIKGTTAYILTFTAAPASFSRFEAIFRSIAATFVY